MNQELGIRNQESGIGNQESAASDLLLSRGRPARLGLGQTNTAESVLRDRCGLCVRTDPSDDTSVMLDGIEDIGKWGCRKPYYLVGCAVVEI
jgi:hypothetical protein